MFFLYIYKLEILYLFRFIILLKIIYFPKFINYIKLNKKNKKFLIKNTSFNPNYDSNYLLTFNEDSYLYLNKTVSNRSKISNCSLSSTNSKISYNNIQNKEKNSRSIKVENSFPKTQIHQKKSNQIYFHKKNCKSNIYSNLNNYNSNNLSKKIQSPNHKNNSNYYCPSFTETNSISNISTSKKKNQINISNTKTLSNEIIITIKKDNSMIEHNNIKEKKLKNKTVKRKKNINSIRPVSPVNLITQFNELNHKNKKNEKVNTNNKKPNIIDIDITMNSKEIKDIKVSKNIINLNNKQFKTRKSNNSKNKKLLINSQMKNSVKNLNKKQKNKHEVNVIKLVSDNSKSNGIKPKKINNNNNNNIKTKPQKNKKSEIQFEIENDIETKNKMISNKRDFALCTTNSSLEEINDKLTLLCIDKGLTLTKIDDFKYICKKNSDNSINIEVSTVGKNNVLKLYHLNGQESITKEIIKNIIMTLAF